MKVRVGIDTAAARAQLRQWGGEIRPKVRQRVARAMDGEARDLTATARDHVAAKLHVHRKSFLASFRSRVVDRDPAKLPALFLGSAVPWVGIHDRGGRIGGPLLIPLY